MHEFSRAALEPIQSVTSYDRAKQNEEQRKECLHKEQQQMQQMQHAVSWLVNP